MSVMEGDTNRASIQEILSPLLFTTRLFGLLPLSKNREGGGYRFRKLSLSYLYSALVILFHIYNVIRLVYPIVCWLQPAIIISYLAIVTIQLYVTCTAVVILSSANNYPELLKQWQAASKIPAEGERPLKRRVLRKTVISLVIIFGIPVTVYSLGMTNSMFAYSPWNTLFRYNFRNETVGMLVFTVVNVGHVFGISTVVLALALFLACCTLVEHELEIHNRHLASALELGRLEFLRNSRLQHAKLIEIVDFLDGIFRHFILTSFVFTFTMICFSAYFIIFINMFGIPPYAAYFSIVLILVNIALLVVMITAASKVNEKVSFILTNFCMSFEMFYHVLIIVLKILEGRTS